MIYMAICIAGFVLSITDIVHDIGWGLHGQLVYVYCQLVIVVGVCLDQGIDFLYNLSCLSKTICRCRSSSRRSLQSLLTQTILDVPPYVTVIPTMAF